MSDCSTSLVHGLYQNPAWQPKVVIECLFQTFVHFTIKSVTVWSFEKNIICFKDLFVEESIIEKKSSSAFKNYGVYKIKNYGVNKTWIFIQF